MKTNIEHVNKKYHLRHKYFQWFVILSNMKLNGLLRVLFLLKIISILLVFASKYCRNKYSTPPDEARHTPVNKAFFNIY